MHIYLFDPRNLRTCSDWLAVPGPVAKLGPVAGIDHQHDEWSFDAFSGTLLPRAGGGFVAYVTAFNKRDIQKTRPFLIESDDGLRWREVGLCRFDNLPPDFEGYLKQPSVIRLDDGSLRMYVWVHGQRGGAAVARLCTASSRDGLTFTIENFEQPILHHVNELRRWGFEPGLTPVENFQSQAQSPPVPPGGVASENSPPDLLSLKRLRSNDSTNIFRDPDTGEFVLYGVFFLPNPVGSPRRDDRDNARSLLRVVTRRTSADGYAFSDPQIVLCPDERDPLDQQFYYLSVHRQDGYHFGFVGDYKIIDQTMDLSLAVSRDGIHWDRPTRSPLIPRFPRSLLSTRRDEATPGANPGAISAPFDSTMIYTIDNLIDAGDDWLMLYRGGTLPHNTGSRSHLVCTTALARIGKRRFIGLDTARNRDARLLTQPFIPTTPTLTLDADIRGQLRAEICDPFGVPFPGYRREDFLAIQGDARRHPLRWKDKDTACFQHEPISLRIEASDCTVFALEA